MQSPWQAEIDQLCGQLGALEVNYLATKRRLLARLDEIAPMSTAWAQAQANAGPISNAIGNTITLPGVGEGERVAAMPVNIEPKAENE